MPKSNRLKFAPKIHIFSNHNHFKANIFLRQIASRCAKISFFYRPEVIKSMIVTDLFRSLMEIQTGKMPLFFMILNVCVFLTHSPCSQHSPDHFLVHLQVPLFIVPLFTHMRLQGSDSLRVVEQFAPPHIAGMATDRCRVEKPLEPQDAEHLDQVVQSVNMQSTKI